MSKRRSKRPSPGSQLGKPSDGNPFYLSPFIDTPSVVPNRRLQLRPKETAVDPVQQMPGTMGKPPSRGPGYIPLSGGPKVKIDDRVKPPEDIIRRANQPNKAGDNPNEINTQLSSPRTKRRGVRGDYSNPADFAKPSDLLSPIIGQPRNLPGSKEELGPEDRRFGPYDTRKSPSKRKPVKPMPPKEEVILEEPHSPNDGGGVGVYYFESGRFLTRGKYNGKASRTTQR